MKDLTQGKERTAILLFAAPMLLGNLFQQAYNFVDSIIVGRLIGDEALAATGASFPIIHALISFVIGIAAGGTIIISQYFGAKNYTQVKRAIDTVLIFVFCASILIMVIGMTFSRKIFELTHLPAEVIPYATIYLNTILSGTIFVFGFNGVSAILRGTGDSKTPLYFLIVASLLNIFLDILFIRFLHWGIRGAALATVIANAFSFLAAALYLNKTHTLIKIKFTNLTFDKEIFSHSFRIGVPSGLQQTFVALGMMALYSIVNHFDTDVITAYSAAGRIDGLAMLPAMTFGQALGTFVGQNIGAGKIERIKRGFLSTISMSLIVSVCTTILIIFFRFNLMSVFTKSHKVVQAGANYLLIVSSAYFIFSIMFSLNGVMRGAGDTLVPMFITLFSLWIIRIPVAFIFSGRLQVFLDTNNINIKLPEILNGQLAETGVWLSVPIAWAMGAICSYFYYRTGNWKKKAVIKHLVCD
jgi:putative MATE family efflux protein